MTPNDPSLIFQSGRVERVPGVDRADAFAIDGLVAGINIIHGPNGSGKSTTARALHEVLWPGRTSVHRASVSGSFQLGPDA